ncbi:protein mono-ADP-ribosyltransferase TIPARP-like [Clinocottus analis]|uniref:protein mono-ADP-ribosyltransferase TIPARP-like n=1 Tax=Clinocottus analis TaxID=304258 RepID=UPI0035C24547
MLNGKRKKKANKGKKDRDFVVWQPPSKASKVGSVPCSGVLQPQTAVRVVTRQHAASQSSCVPTPAPPLMNTQLLQGQPASVFAKALVRPEGRATKPPAPSRVPVPSPFHTKDFSDVPVCDDFLLGLCRAGRNCEEHHTPYPFHWQLWSIVIHQWVDVPPRCQVLLERSYCNVKLDCIDLKGKKDFHRLDFDSMEIVDSRKYDECRRLTNSESAVKNPYFPSKGKIYWWNDVDWTEYDQDLSFLLLKNMGLKEPSCSFFIGSQKYEVDFTTMTQTNVSTRFRRDVRRRASYRSPDYMRPYLQTGILTETVGDPSGANFGADPLEEFTSWYPPVWRLDSEQDYSVVDLPAGTQAYRSVQSLFYESLSETAVDVIGIQQVQNLFHWDKYQRHKAYMKKKHNKFQGPLERHLFHGTTKKASEDICHNNFDPRMAGVNGTSNGHGSYFSPSASFSNAYSYTAGPDKVHHMFLAKVLVGQATLGSSTYRRPPPLRGSNRFLLYDACVDDVENPTMFVVFDSCQCYPYYLIKYKDLPRVIDI